MIIMLDSSEGLDVPSDDLNGFAVEQLLTPLTRRRNFDPTRHFAIDNGAFARFDANGFRSLLSREQERRKLCRFVAVPDVVGSARRTREVFEFWKHELTKWPLAYVLQDGQENIDIPWSDINAVFVGGTDRFKESDAAIQCVKAAQLLGKWVHVGRVNTFSRFELYRQLGADSCDGTGVARYSHMRRAMTARPTLFSAEEIVRVEHP